VHIFSNHNRKQLVRFTFGSSLKRFSCRFSHKWCLWRCFQTISALLQCRESMFNKENREENVSI